jgi:hypothetical protein
MQFSLIDRYHQHFTNLKTEAARFEVFTAVTMKNGVFWDVTPPGFSEWMVAPSCVQA